MKPNPTRSALILIDMENGFVDRRGGHCIKGAQATVPACARALVKMLVNPIVIALFILSTMIIIILKH